MVRNSFIQRKVLEIYQKMDTIVYPMRPETVLRFMPRDCRVLSYQEMAWATGCSVRDVAVLCKSSSGATHLEPDTGRYLILYNDAMNTGRARWTIAHEVGHICLGHLETMEQADIAYTEQRGFFDQLESEADVFAWNLLAPLPIMREMGIRSAAEVRTVYGLSAQAAALQYDRYAKWCKGHIKTAWENGMLRALREKGAAVRPPQ